MKCCICGQNLEGQPAMVDRATGEAFCSRDSQFFGLDPSNRPHHTTSQKDNSKLGHPDKGTSPAAIQQPNCIGVRFDIGKINSGGYGVECWKVFWKAIDPKILSGSQLLEGDTNGTPALENVYCLAVKWPLGGGRVEEVRKALEASAEYQRVAAEPKFITPAQVNKEPLVDGGQVDRSGRLIGGEYCALPALNEIRKENLPTPGNEVRTENLPTLGKVYNDLVEKWNDEISSIQKDASKKSNLAILIGIAVFIIGFIIVSSISSIPSVGEKIGAASPVFPCLSTVILFGTFFATIRLINKYWVQKSKKNAIQQLASDIESAWNKDGNFPKADVLRALATRQPTNSVRPAVIKLLDPSYLSSTGSNIPAPAKAPLPSTSAAPALPSPLPHQANPSLSTKVTLPSEHLENIMSMAMKADWHVPDHVDKLLEPIKYTWGVSCKIVRLTEQQLKEVEQQYPIDTKFEDISQQYQIRLSSNSIFIHEHGAWTNFGYLKFLYHDRIYYVNVAPLVDLTTSIFRRMDDLSHMAKIMISLGERGRSDRTPFMIYLDGDLVQNE
jgi:hypothetical protein